jgi:cytoskeletal protein RodZ
MSATMTLNLVSVRQSRGLTLEEIARATRIAPGYLNAIEAEDFAKLPGGVYATSYLRQYARAIGFSEAELLDQYRALKQPEPAPVLALQQSSRPKTRLGESMAHLLGHLSPKPRTQHPA